MCDTKEALAKMGDTKTTTGKPCCKSEGHHPVAEEGKDDSSCTYYAVVPKTSCEHLKDHVKAASTSEIDQVVATAATAACSTCKDTKENWICLTCYGPFCSRFVKGDMKKHAEAEKHLIAFSVSDCSMWCYGCDSYVIANEVAQKAIDAGYKSKTGETMPPAAVG